LVGRELFLEDIEDQLTSDIVLDLRIHEDVSMPRVWGGSHLKKATNIERLRHYMQWKIIIVMSQMLQDEVVIIVHNHGEADNL